MTPYEMASSTAATYASVTSADRGDAPRGLVRTGTKVRRREKGGRGEEIALRMMPPQTTSLFLLT